MREEINKLYTKKQVKNTKLYKAHLEMINTVDHIILNEIQQFIKNKSNNLILTIQKTHNKKITKLIESQQNTPTNHIKYNTNNNNKNQNQKQQHILPKNPKPHKHRLRQKRT